MKSCLGTTVSGVLSVALLGGCVTRESALHKLGCEASVASYVDQVLMNTWGVGSFACVRLRTKDEREYRTVEAGCPVAKVPRTVTEYPARGNPMVPPAWWDLREGERVEFASMRGPGAHWEGFVYVRRVASEATWFMCGAGL